MAEIMVRDGTWTFDGASVRIVPASDRHVHKLRQLLGALTVPLEAVAGIAYEPGRKGGRLRLRLRDGADPFTQATSGRIPDAGDPYQLSVDADRTGAAEYFADEVRNALLIEQVPSGPCGRYLLPGPSVPLTASAGDGSATFDGEHVTLEWNWATEESKRSAGPQQIALRELDGLDWVPSRGLSNGHMRFRTKGVGSAQPPKYDPLCLVLWGMDKETRTVATLAAAIVARLPHPAAASEQPLMVEAPPVGAAPPRDTVPPQDAATPATGDGDPDALLRRLRELGQLRSDGILTEEEFTLAKQALLRRL